MASVKNPYANEIILSFFDTLIYRRDLDLLRDKNWINDVLIGYYNEYLEKFVYSDHIKEVALIHPDVVFACASVNRDSVIDITKDLDLAGKKFVFMPINNNSDVTEAGGTHWSLLVYHRINNTFYSLDSWNENNLRHARLIAFQMEKALNAPSSPNFESIEVPPQHNGYDCGMYVICFSELLCHQYLTDSKVDLSSITPQFIAEKRQKIYDQILHLREIM